MVGEISFAARLVRRLSGKAPLDPGDADEWRAKLKDLADAITLACYGVSAARTRGAEDARDPLDRLATAAGSYLEDTSRLASLVNHDRQTAVLLGESRRRASKLKERSEYWSTSLIRDSAADHAIWLQHRLIDAAYFSTTAEAYVDDFLLPLPRRAITRAGARKVLRHGRYVTDYVFRRAVTAVSTKLTARAMELKLDLPGHSYGMRVDLSDADVARLAQFESAKGNALMPEVLAIVDAVGVVEPQWE